MFKKTKIKQVMKRSLASVLAVATVFSGLVVPEKAEAFTSSPNDRQICYIDLGASDVRWNTSPSWIAAIDRYSGNKFALAGHGSDYTNESTTQSGEKVWRWYDRILANSQISIDHSAPVPYEPAPHYSVRSGAGAPLFFRDGYYFNGWNFYDEHGSFVGGVSSTSGDSQFNYATKGMDGIITEWFDENRSKATIKATWEAVGYGSGLGQAVTFKLSQSSGTALDPVYTITSTKNKGNYLVAAGNTSIISMSADEN